MRDSSNMTQERPHVLRPPRTGSAPQPPRKAKKVQTAPQSKAPPAKQEPPAKQ